MKLRFINVTTEVGQMTAEEVKSDTHESILKQGQLKRPNDVRRTQGFGGLAEAELKLTRTCGVNFLGGHSHFLHIPWHTRVTTAS